MSQKIIRCTWCEINPTYIKYHDTEWGVPVFKDQKLFECLLLEIFQAGLSWITILKKRETMRLAFDNFNTKKIANYTNKKLEELKRNKGIIRNRLKIESAKKNAIAFIRVQKEFGTFSKYIWQFTNQKTIKNKFKHVKEIPAKTNLSNQISIDLKRRGFKFIGPTIIYAYMQAIGMVNDHTTNCFRYNKI